MISSQQHSQTLEQSMFGAWAGGAADCQVPDPSALSLQPDAKQALAFFAALYPNATGDIIHFRGVPEPKGDRHPRNLHYALDEHFADNLRGFLDWCHVDQRAAFFLPGTVQGNGTGKKDVLTLPAILVDFDKGDPDANLRAAEELIGPATIVVESGGVTNGLPKLHAYWRLVSPASVAEIPTACAIREALALRFGGDPAFKQAAQVIRVPGSIHFKGQPKLVRLRDVRGYAYRLEDIASKLNLSENRSQTTTNPFDLNQYGPQTVDIMDRVLTQPVHEGAVDDITRFEAAGKAIGHYIRQIREGRMTESEAWLAVKEWNAAEMRPSWPEERLRTDFDRLLRADIKEKGPIEPHSSGGGAARDFKLTDWSVRRYEGPAPKQRWLVDRVFPLGDAGILAGDGGIGKSFLALDLCFRIASYRPAPPGTIDLGQPELFGGAIMETGAAAFITAEENEAALHRRLEAIDPNRYRATLGDKLYVASLRELGGGRPFIGNKNQGYPITPYAHKLIAELKAKADLRLVVLDPLAVFFGAETNDRTAAQAFANVLNQMATETGATVIALHHMRKDGEASSRKNVLGSGGFVDAFRFVYTLQKVQRQAQAKYVADYGLENDHGELVIGELAKANGSPEGTEHLYERRPNGVLRQVGRKIDIAAAEHQRRRALLVETVDWYAEWGQPFTKTGRISGLYHNQHALPEALRSLSQRQLEALANEALEKGELQTAAAAREKRQQWLCKPGSRVALGGLEAFRPGARPAWEARPA